MLGYHHPGTRPPRSRHPPEQTPPPQSRPPWSRPPRTDTPLPPEQTPPGTDTPREADSSIRSTSGRYASYWNAFLFLCFVSSSRILVLSFYKQIDYRLLTFIIPLYLEILNENLNLKYLLWANFLYSWF